MEETMQYDEIEKNMKLCGLLLLFSCIWVVEGKN